MPPVVSWAVLVATIAISAVLDAYGFLHAARAWSVDGRLLARPASLSLGCFLVGVVLYVVSIRVQRSVGVHSATMQSAVWFAMTIIGIALVDGSIARWSVVQLGVGVVVVAGLIWLLATTPH